LKLQLLSTSGGPNDYEKMFVAKMSPLKKLGISFEELAREALTAKFGGATEVLLRDLSPGARENPELFVKELSRMFGGGVMSVYEPILKYVDFGMYGPRGQSPVSDLIQRLGPPEGGMRTDGWVGLHQHRIKDEGGDYADNSE